LAWLPIGPVGRGDPDWYVALTDRKCDKLDGFDEPLDTMQKVAKKLCQGLDGDQAAWEDGASGLAAMPAPPPDDCWSVKAYKVLRDVAAFRRQKPEVPFQLAGGSGTACEPTLETLEDDAGSNPPIFVCAGDAIVLVGRLGGLPAGTIRSVNVGTTTAVVRHRDSSADNSRPFGDFYFLAPPLVTGASTRVDVTVADDDWKVTGSASFDYEADPRKCPGFVPPADKAAPPAENVPPADKAVPPAENVPPADKAVPPAENVVPPDKVVPPAEPVPPGSIP
jgi:hypothetical protein